MSRDRSVCVCVSVPLLASVEERRRHIPGITSLILPFNTIFYCLTNRFVGLCALVYTSKYVNASVCAKTPLWTRIHTHQSNLVHQHSPYVKGELERHCHGNLITISAGGDRGKEGSACVCVRKSKVLTDAKKRQRTA